MAFFQSHGSVPLLIFTSSSHARYDIMVSPTQFKNFSTDTVWPYRSVFPDRFNPSPNFLKYKW
jgi:hypothetical protein